MIFSSWNSNKWRNYLLLFLSYVFRAEQFLFLKRIFILIDWVFKSSYGSSFGSCISRLTNISSLQIFLSCWSTAQIDQSAFFPPENKKNELKPSIAVETIDDWTLLGELCQNIKSSNRFLNCSTYDMFAENNLKVQI